ncbi:substrate-binding periplasmic protein [Pseudoalteromonas tunicata]|uniref:substrate-binding periplasmic protein n=1 Tax=Pseudoalteromonas tunicata TaxID=314281 RepID=UPI00273D65B6|nr:transporter substrate-binding domain-containing protein [Pseudoalteromonas tunicata]MDP4983274.1 transporter substrate-binding domain-containing protein [Pseudoalteromonas tunicata]MDP5214095.1 transporter substrate-binding domain-containing protein [Pseudoalteromonas tunicata]
MLGFVVLMRLSVYFLLLVLNTSLYAKEQLSIVTEEWAPYSVTNANHKVVGTATAKVRWVLEQAEIDYTLNSYPWARAIQLVQQNPNTMIYSIYRTKARETQFKWVCPLFEPVPLFLYKLKSRSDITAKNIEQAKDFLLSVTRDDMVNDYLIEAGFEIGRNLDISPNGQTSLKKLFANRIDFVIYSEKTLISELKGLNFSYGSFEKVVEIPLAQTAQICMAFNQDTDDALVFKVQQMLDLLNLIKEPIASH